jgi:hypothetical protein
MQIASFSKVRCYSPFGTTCHIEPRETPTCSALAQIDIGFGDAVTPGPEDSVYPVLLNDLPAPRLRTYPSYTVIAEKLHAIALLGMTNSRLKDYFDLSILIERETLNPALLAQAINATFERRGMPIPTTLPLSQRDRKFAGMLDSCPETSA